MRILGIDTSTNFFCLGVYQDGRICEYNLDAGRKLSGIITLTIKRVIGALGWRLNDIDYFAVGLGPGSFTGLRVGVATVKGLAFSLNKPVIGIPTLDLLVANAPEGAERVIPVVDAKRGLVYAGVYRRDNGKIIRTGPNMLLTMDELLKKSGTREKTAVLGDAIGLYKQDLTRMKNAALLDKDYWYPNGRNLMKLAIEAAASGKAGNAFGIKPVYLYPKECQIRYKSRVTPRLLGARKSQEC